MIFAERILRALNEVSARKLAGSQLLSAMQGMADHLSEYIDMPVSINRAALALQVDLEPKKVIEVLVTRMKYKPWTSKFVRNTTGIFVRPGNVAPVQVQDSMGVTRISIMGLTLPHWDLILKDFPLHGKTHQITIATRRGYSEVTGSRSDKSEAALPLKELGFVLERETPRLYEKTYVSKEHGLTLNTWEKSAGYGDFVIADTPDYRDLM